MARDDDKIPSLMDDWPPGKRADGTFNIHPDMATAMRAQALFRAQQEAASRGEDPRLLTLENFEDLADDGDGGGDASDIGDYDHLL